VSTRIVTDSTADLPPELISELGITVVPAYVGFGSKTYRDGVDISQDELYCRMVEDNIPATTSQPPPADFVEAYRKLLKDTDKLISIHVTSKLSGIYSSALAGKDMVGGHNRIAVVDSQSVSMGLGLLTLMAARMAKLGDDMSDILESLRLSVPRIKAFGVLESLKYILQGGRLGKAKALLGSMLPLRPMITMRDGELHPVGFARTRAKAFERFFSISQGVEDIEEAAVVHATSPADALTLKEKLSALVDKNKIYISRLGPALGVHGGPGTIILALKQKIKAIPELNHLQPDVSGP
jgi:fatty acid kinase fatty acid binding subunit